MRSIFTYPSNLSTEYIDPDYWCSENPISSSPPPDGFAKRMYDLTNTAPQRGGGNIAAPAGWNDHAKFVSAFEDGYFADSRITDDNLGLYDIWCKPLFAVDTELAQNNISALTYSAVRTQSSDFKTTGVYEISNVQVRRDPTDAPVITGISAWRMPHNTKFNLDWDITQYGTINT